MIRSKIVPDGSLNKAAEILSSVFSNKGTLNIVFGNKFAPMPLMSWDNFRQQEENKNPAPSLPEIYRRYWHYLEAIRFTSYNNLPSPNYYYLSVLMQELDCNIVTTNYDGFLESALDRTGLTYVLNPCDLAGGTHPEWHQDGYLCSDLHCQRRLWKIHGSLAFARFSCAHVFRLPKFSLAFPAESQFNKYRYPQLRISLLHNTVCTSDGRLFSDPRLTDDHPTITYNHHVDWDAARGIFKREFESAERNILQSKQPIFVLGLSAEERYPEDIVPVLQKAQSNGITIIYIMPSLKPLMPDSNEILGELVKTGGNLILVNELSKGIVDSFMLLVEAATGRNNLYDEFISNWRTSGRWLIPKRIPKRR